MIVPQRVPPTPEVPRGDCEAADEYEPSETRDPAPTHETGVEDEADAPGSSSSSSEDTSELEEDIRNKMLPVEDEPEVPGPLYQHYKSRVLHRPGASSTTLKCGRRASGAYRWLPEGASFQWARCAFCFRGEVLATRSQVISRLDALRNARAG